ncbi:hypothetical protein [Corynebacterium provencense]|uniref:hypothetical protein n=1 Tax=Corynebacterium provencense TaxID=1737425 RepID=UPI0011C8C7D2|nr:hypothetical protein [Corynebacterium provencense]
MRISAEAAEAHRILAEQIGADINDPGWQTEWASRATTQIRQRIDRIIAEEQLNPPAMDEVPTLEPLEAKPQILAVYRADLGAAVSAANDELKKQAQNWGTGRSLRTGDGPSAGAGSPDSCPPRPAGAPGR